MKSIYRLLAVLVLLIPAGVAAAMQGNGTIDYRSTSKNLVGVSADLNTMDLQNGNADLLIQEKLYTADRIFTKEENGRTLMYMYFTDFPKATNGDVEVFIGTLLENGTSMKYYGDIFVGRQMDVDLDNYTLAEHHEDLYFIGAFFFDYPKS